MPTSKGFLPKFTQMKKDYPLAEIPRKVYIEYIREIRRIRRQYHILDGIDLTRALWGELSFKLETGRGDIVYSPIKIRSKSGEVTVIGYYPDRRPLNSTGKIDPRSALDAAFTHYYGKIIEGHETCRTGKWKHPFQSRSPRLSNA